LLRRGSPLLFSMVTFQEELNIEYVALKRFRKEKRCG